MPLGPVPESKVYEAPGSCIYCGEAQNSASCELMPEHIIPLGLGGRLVFRHASCTTCADETKKFEQACLRKMFFQTRTDLRIPSYRPNEDASRIFNMGTPPSDRLDSLGKSQPPNWTKYQSHGGSLGNQPSTILFPTFDLPGIVLGRDPSDNIMIQGIVTTISNLQNVEIGTVAKE